LLKADTDTDAEHGMRAKQTKRIRKNTEQRLIPMQCDRMPALLSIKDGVEELRRIVVKSTFIH
jgi:hypothetical protein